MLRCIAVDDEPPALELLEDYISQVSYLNLVAVCDDPLEAMQIIANDQIDLVFLDIQMPAITGLQLIRKLAKKPMFILVTAYEKYALEGFDLNVVDYLVKPVPYDRFLQAADKAWQLYQLKAGPVNLQQAAPADHFFVYADGTHVRILFDDICRVEAQKDYVRIYFVTDQKPLVARLSMKSMEEQLPSDRFIRIQKSYIVARTRISAIRKNSVIVAGRELPIGDIYREAVYAILGRPID